MRRKDHEWEMQRSDEIREAPLPPPIPSTPFTYPPPPAPPPPPVPLLSSEEDFNDLNVNANLVKNAACSSNHCCTSHQTRTSSHHTRASPNHSCTSPIHSCTSPIHSGTSPIHSCTSPIHSCTSPIHSCTSPNHSCTSPTTPSLPLPRTSPPAVNERLNLLRGLFLCQITSLLICGTAVFSTLLVSHDVNIPTLQSFGNYCCLAIVYTITFLYKTPTHILRRTFNERWWKYLLVALFDVEGNYMMVKAYQYTSITSVQLLDSVTIPVVLVLSWMFLKYRYQSIHVGGVVVAMLGMGIMIYADVKRETSGGGLNETDIIGFDGVTSEEFSNSSVSTNSTGNLSWVGDLLAVLGATCYGFSNVGQEYFVNNAGQHEFLAALGFFGALINGVQFAALEWREASTIAATASSKVLFYIIGFNLCLFAIYSIVPKTFQLTSAAVFNISILTSDFYTFLFGLFLFLLPLDPMYFVAYFLVIVGIIVYSYKTVPTGPSG